MMSAIATYLAIIGSKMWSCLLTILFCRATVVHFFPSGETLTVYDLGARP